MDIAPLLNVDELFPANRVRGSEDTADDDGSRHGHRAVDVSSVLWIGHGQSETQPRITGNARAALRFVISGSKFLSRIPARQITAFPRNGRS
jgi:hypothetical protein